MQSEDLRTSLRRRLAATLDDPRPWSHEPADGAPATRLSLEAFGDALRAGVTVPAAPRRWLRGLRDPAARAALDLVRGELPAWAAEARDGSLELALRRRDRAASALAALAWRFVSDPPGPELAGALDALDAALGGFDAALTLARTEADALLGERVFLAVDGWRAALRDDRALDDLGGEPAPPTDAMLDAWLREGRFHRSVEAAAARDAGFADDLGALVDDALLDARGDRTLPVSFAARRWRQRSAARVRVDVELGRVALAAASHDGAPAAVRVALGRLAPLDADAAVRVDGGRATLSVHAEPGVVASLSVGAARAEPDADGSCELSFAATAAGVPVRVRSADGVEVGFDLAFPDAADDR